MKRKTVSNDILRKAARKHGLLTRFLDGQRRKVLYVTDTKKFFVSNSRPSYFGIYPTNLRFTYDLFKDKAWTKQLLKKYRYRVSRGDYFYLDSSWSRKEPSRSVQSALAYAEKIGYPVFVKPNSGSQGNYATVVYNKTQLQKHLSLMRHYAQVYLIEEVTQSPEYRIFIVGGKPMFSYQRERTAIVGDGRSRIIEILDRLHILPSPFIQAHLRAKKMTLKSVLRQGDTVDVLPVANISQGAKIKDYNERFTQETKEWAKNLYKITGNHIIGVDIFTSQGPNNPDSFTIIELNHQPSLVGIWEAGHQDMVYHVWDQIFKKYFGKDYQIKNT